MPIKSPDSPPVRNDSGHKLSTNCLSLQATAHGFENNSSIEPDIAYSGWASASPESTVQPMPTRLAWFADAKDCGLSANR